MIQKIKLEITKNNLTQQINEQTAQQQQYEEELNRVGTAEYYEYLARKYLGYIYPDENILIVTNQEDTGNSK
jgi:cell division protein FtsB